MEKQTKEDCGCGWDGGLRRYCDTHNPCFPTTAESLVPQRDRRIGVAAVAYMRDRMGMTDSDSDQEQNFILGHLHTFACEQVDLYLAQTKGR